MVLEYSLESVKETATVLWKRYSNAKVFAFHGALGAGKTTFIHALCQVIGVTDAVSSPTFSIINEYAYRQESRDSSLYHIDLYRLRDEEEAIRAGVEDCLYSGLICLVEWPERAPGLIPPDAIHISFEVLGESKRRLKINGN